MSPSPTRRAVTIAAPAVVVVVIGWWGFESAASPDVARWNTAVVTAVFAAFVTVATVGAWRRPTDPRPTRLAVAATLLTVSYFRFVQPPWLASIGALAWLASPAFLLATFTEPARAARGTSFARWSVAFAIVGAMMVAVSGPDRSGTPRDAVRAVSWAWYDHRVDLMVRQPNPLAVTTSAAAVVALTILWCMLLVAFAACIARAARAARAARGRTWRALVWCAAAGTIVLAIPLRLGQHPALLDREWGDPLIAVPLVCSAAYAGWTVWNELITPRLARPETLVLQLDAASSVEATRRRLRRVLGDPSALIVFPSTNGWIDDVGRPCDDRPGRRLVTVTGEGKTIAGLDLDAATPIAPDLLADAAGSLAVSLEAQRLAATATALANEAREATMRLLDVERAAIDEIGHQIETGPIRTLVGVEALLEQRPLRLETVHDELRRSLEQVRAISHRASPDPEEMA